MFTWTSAECRTFDMKDCLIKVVSTSILHEQKFIVLTVIFCFLVFRVGLGLMSILHHSHGRLRYVSISTL